jgi:hypothetical protein
METIRAIDTLRLARAVAERLRSIAPAAVSVRTEGALVLFRYAGAWLGASDIGTATQPSSRSAGEQVCLAASNALDEFQDYLSEASRNAWPRFGPEGRGPIGQADVRLAGGVVQWRFVGGDYPPLALDDLVVEEFLLRP